MTMIHANDIAKARGILGAPFKIGSDAVRWCENPAAVGLRAVGFVDEIKPDGGRALVDHQGWFLDESQGEVARGVVYRLPHGRFVYGVADPCGNDGAAMLALNDVTADESDAIRWADDLARIFAEHERQYCEAGNARLRHDDLGDTIKTLRLERRRLTRELTAIMRATYPHIAATTAARLDAIANEMAAAHAERGKLADQFGRDPGWKDQ